jgi:hypothetical protein
MGYNNIQYGLQNSGVYSSAGAERIIFIPFEDVKSYEVVDGDVVNNIFLFPNKKYHLFDALDDISYLMTTSNTKAGKLYQLDVSFNVPNETGFKNALFDQLTDTELVAIVQDNNFVWWLLGHEQPLKVISNEEKIDNDNNGYTLKLSSKQREMPYHMSDSWIANINNLPFSSVLNNNGTVVTVVINSPVPPNNPNTPTIPMNAGNVKVAPPNNYVIENDIEYVLAIGGRTVKMPTNPVDGQQHVIKDLNSTAYLLPITIDGNGRAIDSDLQIKIDTKDGAVSLFYAANKWNTHTFIN